MSIVQIDGVTFEIKPFEATSKEPSWYVLSCKEYPDFYMMWPDLQELIDDIPAAFKMWKEATYK